MNDVQRACQRTPAELQQRLQRSIATTTAHFNPTNAAAARRDTVADS